jgi:hypothetical protein
VIRETNNILEHTDDITKNKKKKNNKNSSNSILGLQHLTSSCLA